MNKRALVVLILLTLINPIVAKSNPSSYIENESASWRVGIAVTTASLIKDDVLRGYFTDRVYIMEKYASAPKNWDNPIDHENITDVFIWNYEEFVKYLKENDWDMAIKYYSIMAHYIGDAADPYSVEPSNKTVYQTYETYLELVSGDVFSYIYSSKTTLELKKIDDIEKALQSLISLSKNYKSQCDDAIYSNDTATLDYVINTLGKKAVSTLYGILLKAFDESGIGEINKVIYRYSMILFAASVSAILLVAIRQVIFKRKRKEEVFEGEL